MSENIIIFDDLSLGFQTEDGFLPVLDRISFSVRQGEFFALVGESGCGKSLTSLSVSWLHQEPPARYSGGRVMVQGRDVLKMSARELQKLRGGVVAYVFQEPSTSLNPVLRVGRQIAETVRLHDSSCRDVRARTLELLEMVGIPEPEIAVRAYPSELSGGMQQRVMIAMALSCSPAILVADEPTTALDVTVQAQILALLLKLQRETGMTILLVTHNLGVVSQVADRVAVMYAGRIVEQAPVKDILQNPAHPYTRALLDAVPRPGSEAKRLGTIPGRVPEPAEYGEGCRFAQRCNRAKTLCHSIPPPAIAIGKDHTACCHYPLDLDHRHVSRVVEL